MEIGQSGMCWYLKQGIDKSLKFENNWFDWVSYGISFLKLLLFSEEWFHVLFGLNHCVHSTSCAKILELSAVMTNSSTNDVRFLTTMNKSMGPYYQYLKNWLDRSQTQINWNTTMTQHQMKQKIATNLNNTSKNAAFFVVFVFFKIDHS